MRGMGLVGRSDVRDPTLGRGRGRLHDWHFWRVGRSGVVEHLSVGIGSMGVLMLHGCSRDLSCP